ncbi:MAG: hypothetical protein LBD43_01650 [Holosporales bacterium]|jgi:hypothetical protein|nr:hypothetical protein [Holosporales bacterium]
MKKMIIILVMTLVAISVASASCPEAPLLVVCPKNPPKLQPCLDACTPGNTDTPGVYSSPAEEI